MPRVPQAFFPMPRDPDIGRRFANTVLEELARLRCEQVSQRKLIVELLSVITKERRRKIKDRAFERREHWRIVADELKEDVGLLPPAGTDS